MKASRVFGIVRVEKSDGQLEVVGRAYETICLGDTLLACTSEESDANCATFQVSKINVFHREIDQVDAGYSALLVLSGKGEKILSEAKYLFASSQ